MKERSVDVVRDALDVVLYGEHDGPCAVDVRQDKVGVVQVRLDFVKARMAYATLTKQLQTPHFQPRGHNSQLAFVSSPFSVPHRTPGQGKYAKQLTGCDNIGPTLRVQIMVQFTAVNAICMLFIPINITNMITDHKYKDKLNPLSYQNLPMALIFSANRL